MPQSYNISSRQAKRQRSPSPSDQLREDIELQSLSLKRRRSQRISQRIVGLSRQHTPQKRLYQSRQTIPSQPSRERLTSANSSAPSISQFYGSDDYNALDNLFAAYPQRFSTLPLPHGSQGAREPFWDLQFNHDIHLHSSFPRGRPRIQRVRAPVPGPELDIFASLSPELESPPSSNRPPTRTRAEFETAMSIVQEVIGEGRRLTIDLARSYERVRAWRERWGWSPLSSDAYDSPPPYSPPRSPPTQSPRVSPAPISISSSSVRQSISPGPEAILNPPIPGDSAPSAEALFNTVNDFAKENGFGIVRRNAYSYRGRQIRYSF